MKSIVDTLFVRGRHVCPWWFCFTFDNFIRKYFQNPFTILEGLVKPGDTVIDIGPGQGYFTLPMAGMVGENGRVYAIDVQKQMLEKIGKRAVRSGIENRVVKKLVSNRSLELDMKVDFALAFWMVHEVPDRESFLREIHEALKPCKNFLIAEPALHVSRKMFEQTLTLSQKTGFKIIDRPKIFLSRAALLRR